MKVLLVIFSFMLILCVCAYASDIAFYVGQWNTDGWYDAAQFDHVEMIINETGAMFEDIQQFNDDQLDEFGEWAEARIDDDKVDIIWLNGCMPSCLYPNPNLEPDGSVAERWLDGGNMIINVGDWFAYCTYEGGARGADNGGTGAANILDLSSGIIYSADGTQMEVTDTGKKYMPSLNDPMKCDRPVSVRQATGDWEVVAIFASIGGSDDPTKATAADPVVLHNTKTDGYLAIINQAAGGAAGWAKDRGAIVAEFIKNWVGEKLELISVEPARKLTTTWGEVKHVR